MRVSRDDLFSNLPAFTGTVTENYDFQQNRSLIILDDDPTGCQTVNNVPLLFTWEKSEIEDKLRKRVPVFFILTNTRSLSPKQTRSRLNKVMDNIFSASANTGRKISILSRSDSTLRGHFPLETNLITSKLGYKCPLICFIPAFFQGGRYTIDDEHYVEEDGFLIPASETPFAGDPAFGFSTSNLFEYLHEKTSGNIRKNQILSFSHEEIRSSIPSAIAQKLIKTQAKVFFANATEQKDLDIIARAAWEAIDSGREIIFRSSASFINSVGNITPSKRLINPGSSKTNKSGILIIVGFYVEKTSRQLDHLLGNAEIYSFSIDIESLLRGKFDSSLGSRISDLLTDGKDCLIYTSRKFVSGKSQTGLEAGKLISDYLVQLVREIKIEPAAIITKGGITSHTIAKDALEIREANVIGQILPGVPVIEPLSGLMPGLCYVIFPGNVGGPEALLEVYNKLKN